MKLLLLDIETAPNLAYVWGLWQQNVSIDKIVNSGYVLCWSARWHGEPTAKTQFASVRRGRKAMLRRIHRLLDEADAVVHYNGSSFDIPTLNKEFVSAGMKPPTPYKQIDLLLTVRKQFRFPSNKLDYVCQALGIGAKVKHEGFEMWVKCMAGEDAAWTEMEKYNRHDVEVLALLYDKLVPWIRYHPNRGAYDPDAKCPKCGSAELQRRGTQVTTTLQYARYQCRSCGGWSRSAASVRGVRAHYTNVNL